MSVSPSPGFQIFDPASKILAQLMKLSLQHHEVIAHNIANVNTPNYTRQTFLFEHSLREAIENYSMDPQKLEQVQGQIVPDRKNPPREDGNNVRLEEESGMLLLNSLNHQLYTQALQKKIRIMKLAIGGGR